MCVQENNNRSSSSENNDDDNTKDNYNKSWLLGTRRKGDHKHQLKLSKSILKPIPCTTLSSFESSQKIVKWKAQNHIKLKRKSKIVAQQVKFMADICRWDSLTFRFKIHCLRSCWVCAPPQKSMSSILLISFKRPLLWIVCKFFLSCVVFNYIQGIFSHCLLLQFYLFFYSILISF